MIIGAGERICPLDTIKAFSDVICADGGYKHIKNIIKPTLIIGDFDSLSIKNVPKYIHVKSYPKKKDETDIELAIIHSIDEGFDSLYVTGVTGSRDDHFITALSLLEKYKKTEIHILTEEYDIFIMNKMRKYSFVNMKNSQVSFLSVTEKTAHIVSNGLEYEYNGNSLSRNNPIGVSNRIVKNNAELKFEKGLVLCFLKIS